MLDSLSLNPFKFSDAGKKKGSPFGFHMLKKGNNLFDGVTGTTAACSISGARWGIVNGVVTQFAVNQTPVEDDGLRGCPAFTSYWSSSDIGNGVSHSIEDGWNKLTLLSNTGQYTFCRALGDSTVTGDVSIMQAIIKKRYCSFLWF